MKNKSIHRRKIELAVAFLSIFILIALSLWNFQTRMKKLEYSRGEQILEDLAGQGATIVENKINAVISALQAAAAALQYDESFQDDKVMQYLTEIVEKKNTDLVRIGIADLNGNARITDGREMNLSECTFFKHALEGEEYVSALVTLSQEQESIAIAIPVYAEENRVKAVLYGIIQADSFHLYTSTQYDESRTEQYIHIIDEQGNFVVRSRNTGSLIAGENFYAGLENAATSVPVEEVKASLEQGKEISMQVQKDGENRYVHLTPRGKNKWCIVTVLSGEVIERQLAASQKMVARLLIELFGILLIWGGYYYYVILKEKDKVEKLNQELAVKEQIFRLAISEIGNYVFTYDINTRVLEFMNYDPERVPFPQVMENFSKNVFNYVPQGSEAYQKIEQLLQKFRQGMQKVEGELTFRMGEGQVTYYARTTSIMNKNNKVIRVVGSLKDITEEKQKELQIRKGEQIRSAVLSDTIGFFEVDLNKDRLLRDGEMKETEYTYTENVEQFCERVVSESHRQKVRQTFSVANLLQMYENGVHDVVLEYQRSSKAGRNFWVRCEAHLKKDIVSGDILAMAVLRNIDDKKEREIKLKQQANLDPLTKLYNRGACSERVNEILKKNYRTNTFMLIDLDNFKSINDTLGHLVGDTVLVDVADILKQHVRSEDIVCRLGGDEFIVFLVGIPQNVIARNADRLLKKLNLIYERDGISGVVSATIGIAVAPEHGSDFQTLYEKADIALYEAKNGGKNNYRIYEEK